MSSSFQLQTVGKTSSSLQRRGNWNENHVSSTTFGFENKERKDCLKLYRSSNDDGNKSAKFIGSKGKTLVYKGTTVMSILIKRFISEKNSQINFYMLSFVLRTLWLIKESFMMYTYIMSTKNWKVLITKVYKTVTQKTFIKKYLIKKLNLVVGL